MILCLGRTGSTHLVSLLDSHPQIRCFGELFTYQEGTLDEAYITSSRSDPEDYLAHLTAPLTESAVGFKLPLSSLRAHPDVLELLQPKDLRMVRLRRLNLLALLVSRRLLASTRVPQSTRGDYGDATVVLDPKQCLAVLKRIEEHESYLDEIAAGKPVFRITYEELVTGQRARRDPELPGRRARRAAIAVQPRPQPSHGGDDRELVRGRGRPARLALREVPRG